MADVKWIKIVTDIFDNRKVKQIEKLPESDAIINIWFRLLCLAGSINEDGRLLLTQEVPYTEDMLVNEFNKSKEIIRLALTVFVKFQMIEIIDDIYCISNWEKYQNIDGLEKIREQNRLRQAKFKEKNKNNVLVTLPVTQSNATDKEIEIEIEKEKDIKIKKDNISKIVTDFCEDKQLQDNIFDFIDMRKKIKAPMTDKAITLLLNKLSKYNSIDLQIQVLEQSIINGWKDIYDLKQEKKDNNKQNGNIFLQIAKEEGMF